MFPMMSNMVTTLLYPIWCYLFIYKLRWGAIGCALADLIGMSITFAANLFYTWACSDLKEANRWWKLDFHDFGAQNKMGMWSAFNSIIEGLSQQYLMIMCGFLCVADQAANTMVMNIVLLVQCIG